MNAQYTIDSAKLDEFQDLMEDTIAYFCDEYMVSGELAWILAETFAQTKQEELRGAFDEDQNT